jgi:hypothetical protein
MQSDSMDEVQTAELTSPFHTQGITDKTQARTHYLGGRQIACYRDNTFEGSTTNNVLTPILFHYVSGVSPGRDIGTRTRAKE